MDISSALDITNHWQKIVASRKLDGVKPSLAGTIHTEAAKVEETVTVLLSNEIYDFRTMRCVEIGVVAITGTHLQVAFICESLRDTNFDILNVEENLKIYEECKMALREFKKK